MNSKLLTIIHYKYSSGENYEAGGAGSNLVFSTNYAPCTEVGILAVHALTKTNFLKMLKNYQ